MDSLYTVGYYVTKTSANSSAVYWSRVSCDNDTAMLLAEVIVTSFPTVQTIYTIWYNFDTVLYQFLETGPSRSNHKPWLKLYFSRSNHKPWLKLYFSRSYNKPRRYSSDRECWYDSQELVNRGIRYTFNYFSNLKKVQICIFLMF